MKRKSIFQQVLLLLICVVIIPLFIAYSVLSSILIANLQQNHNDDVESSAYSASKSFKDAFGSVVDVSILIIGNPYIREFLINAAGDKYLFLDFKSAYAALEKCYVGNNYISCVQVATTDGRYMLSSGLTQPLPFTQKEKSRMTGSNGAWFCERNDTGQLVVYRLMNNTHNRNQKLGFIKLTINETMLIRQITANSLSVKCSFAVLDTLGETVLVSTGEYDNMQIVEMINGSHDYIRRGTLLTAQQHGHYIVRNRLKVNTQIMDFVAIAQNRSVYYNIMKYSIVLLFLLLLALFSGLYAAYYRKQIVIPL